MAIKKRLIVWLNEENLERDLVGGKALNLARLKKAGFNVPNAFVITTQAFGKMDQDLKRLIEKNFKKLKTEKVAVRSSATCEDKSFDSFAGQFESFLGVSQSNLFKTIEECWQSVFSERVKIYCLHHQLKPESIKMAVIIQKMILAEKGGVVFSRDVFQQRKNVLVIEAAQGLGERVVSGLVNPERVVVEKNSGKIIERHLINGPVLTEKEIEKLTQVSLQIESFYHSPQDIEWAMMKGRLYLLQSRPITGFSK